MGNLPADAITVTGTDAAGGGSTVVLSADSANPVTVFTIDHLHEGPGNSVLSCNGLPISYMPFPGITNKRDVRYVCVNDVTLAAGGVGSSAEVSLTYAPYNFAEVTGGVVHTSQPWHLSRVWSLGDIAIVALLIPIGAILLWGAIYQAFTKPVRYHK